MRTMIVAFVAVFVIAVGADYALDHAGYSTEDQNAGTAVRLD